MFVKRCSTGAVLSLRDANYLLSTCLFSNNTDHSCTRAKIGSVFVANRVEVRHMYCFSYALECIISCLNTSYSKGTARTSNVWRFGEIKSLLSQHMLSCGLKPSHISTNSALLEFQEVVEFHGGSVVSVIDFPAPCVANLVYIKFCMYNRYLYVGETGCTDRPLHQHLRACSGPRAKKQRVHHVIGGFGPTRFDTLVANFPVHTNRREVELALIAKFDTRGKYLLNDMDRSYGPRNIKASHANKTLNPHKHTTHKRCMHSFRRPFVRLTPANPRPFLEREPAVVLFGGGMGGVTKGLLDSGKFDVRVVVEADADAAATHRKRYPRIPVLVHTLGESVDRFLERFVRFVPRSQWCKLFVQASPPCRKLSRNVTITDTNDAMHLTRWTLSLLESQLRCNFMIENVPAVLDYLNRPDLHAYVCSMEYYVPQARKRAIISNCLNLQNYSPPSSVPIAAMHVYLQ